MSAALALLARDVKLAFREGGAIGTALGFYLVVIAIAPLGLGPDLNLLARIAPGLLWVALLLAALLSADRIFHNDYEDGALDVLTTAIGASLTLGLKRSGLLLALIVLPLYVPVLIFGVAAASAAITGPASPWPPFLMLCALSLASIVLAPLAASASLRTALR
jgi:heme exporter protein B